MYTKKFIMYVWLAFFTAAEARFHHREARLHEHDQEARDQRPYEVDGDFVLPHLVGNVGQRHALVESAAGTSLMVPVIVPPGSPLARSAVAGAFACGVLQLLRQRPEAVLRRAAAGAWAWAQRPVARTIARKQRKT